MKYRGVIFDFNGVLIWDTSLQEKAWKTYSLEKRGTIFSEEEMHIHVHGRNNRHTLSYLMERKLNNDELELFTQEKEIIYRQLCLDWGRSFQLSPGATSLLDFLKSYDFPRTIATASEKSNLDFFIKHLDLETWFNINQIIYDDGSIEGKPNPDIYLKAASKIELEPSECIVIEDSASGIQAALEAGIGYIIALGDETAQRKLAELRGVQMVVQTLNEFPKQMLEI